MSKLANTVLDKIKIRKIKPRSRWYFRLKNILLWSTVVFSVGLGGLASGIVLQEFFGVDWEVARQLTRGSFAAFLLVLPYVWLGGLLLTLVLATWVYTSTEKGYRYRPSWILGVTIFVSLLAGVFFWATGVSNSFEKWIHKNFRPYTEWQQRRERRFFAPEQGILPGKVVKIQPNDTLILRDPTGQLWTIDLSAARAKNNFVPRVDFPLLVKGVKTGKAQFQAQKVQQPPLRKNFLNRRKNNLKENSPELRIKR